MLIEFKVANYRSIGEEQTISFVAERGVRRHLNNLISRKGYNLLKAIGLYGANASGKSNLIAAIKAMRNFVIISATRMNEGDRIPACDPHRLIRNGTGGISRFETTFLEANVVTRYGFAVSSERVIEEWLIARPTVASKDEISFSRSYNNIETGYVYSWHGIEQSERDLLHKRTRENALVTTTAARESIAALSAPYRYMQSSVEAFDLARSETIWLMVTAAICKLEPRQQNLVNRLLRDADTGISDLHVNPDWSFPALGDTDFAIEPETIQNFLGGLEALFGAFGKRGEPIARTLHKDLAGENVEFDLERDESSGTKRFLALLGPLLASLDSGSFLAIDEIDASMHPLLTRRLLELFQSPEANPNGAQLLFTMHDASLLDQELFRRDQIWLAEKQNGQSRYFSLADIEPKPRNTEAFLRNYLAGRYGGTPNIGPAFDRLKTGAA